MLSDLYTCSIEKGPGTIVLLEPDERLLKVMAMAIWQEVGFFPCTASSVADAVELIWEKRNLLLAVAVGFETKGVEALLDIMVKGGLPAVVYGNEYTEEIRRRLATLAIADVVAGEQTVQISGVAQSLARLIDNQTSPILVVDDSRSMRSALARFLGSRCFKVYEAVDGLEALEKLKKYPQIKLVITDYEMPNMDGFSLIREIRKTYSKEDLAVIGISAKINSMLSVEFINNGANDFLQKPFVKEELYCRVDHNLDMLRRIETIRDLSNKDPMTKLYNRRYFFDHCEEFAEGRPMAVAMVDIDLFKHVNDTYGHDVGDAVIVSVANSLNEAFEDAIVARFGGEEFCVLLPVDNKLDLYEVFDSVRRKIGKTMVSADGVELAVTVSIGVSTVSAPVLDMIKASDALLYTAKESGRNQVIIS